VAEDGSGHAATPREPIEVASFPAVPGVYIVWAPHEIGRPIYVGSAATQTIEQRWRRQHLRNRAGGSALRRSLGPHLGLVAKKLSVSRDGRYYPPEVEREITAFLLTCEVEFIAADSAEEARGLELQLIEELRPLLNARRRPRIARTASERELLRGARALYENSVKAALTQGLLSVNREAKLDPGSGYVPDVRDNLLPGVTLEAIREEFAAGAGNELESKMRAPWSSSALAVNSFAPWSADSGLLPLAGRSGFDTPFSFEKPCPNGVSSIAPHLDVLLRRQGEVVAVESKCTEYLQGSDHEPVAASYKRLAERGDERADSRWFAALSQTERFLLLDAYQLIKHYLGLRETFKDERPHLTLAYLFWEPSNSEGGAGADLFRLHRAELDTFAHLVAGDESCEFVATSYTEWWRALEGMPQKPMWLDDHINRLRARYLVAV
jgi:hypothetical protein